MRNRIQKEGANPISETKTAPVTTPPTANTLRPKRSAKYPKKGWGSAVAIANAELRAAAAAIVSPILSMIRGSSGGTKEA